MRLVDSKVLRVVTMSLSGRRPQVIPIGIKSYLQYVEAYEGIINADMMQREDGSLECLYIDKRGFLDSLAHSISWSRTTSLTNPTSKYGTGLLCLLVPTCHKLQVVRCRSDGRSSNSGLCIL